MSALVSQYGGGWFSDRSASTGSLPVNAGATTVLITTLAFGAGTGSFVDDVDYWRQTSLNRFAVYGSKSPVVDWPVVRTPAEDLAQIRRVLSPAISDLASAFGVSRQAIYNWLAGEQPSLAHRAKLSDLAFAADILGAAHVSVSGTLLKRKVVDGKNLFEIVRDGGSVKYAAELLVSVVRRETEQREMMSKRLAGRNISSRSVDSDFPSENDGV
jgi:transcriptional regulator with XRE-family HTH domain